MQRLDSRFVRLNCQEWEAWNRIGQKESNKSQSLTFETLQERVKATSHSNGLRLGARLAARSLCFISEIHRKQQEQESSMVSWTRKATKVGSFSFRKYSLWSSPSFTKSRRQVPVQSAQAGGQQAKRQNETRLKMCFPELMENVCVLLDMKKRLCHFNVLQTYRVLTLAVISRGTMVRLVPGNGAHLIREGTGMHRPWRLSLSALSRPTVHHAPSFDHHIPQA
jgi:hypothetical protein